MSTVPVAAILLVCVLNASAWADYISSSPVGSESTEITVYPKTIVQGGEDRSACTVETRRSTCCSLSVTKCCSQDCYTAPEVKEKANDYQPEIKSNDCGKYDRSRCCTGDQSACCTKCYNEIHFAQNAVSQAKTTAVMLPVDDPICPTAKRAKLCCTYEGEHLNHCCLDKMKCPGSDVVGSMKMGTLKDCPVPMEHRKCCKPHSDTCCRACGKEDPHITVEVDLAQPKGFEDCPLKNNPCCSSVYQRCCNQCDSPLRKN